MAKFIIRDTLACMVTWTYECEAESVEDAQQLFMDGALACTGDTPIIGDCIEYVPQCTEIEQVRP